jgi:hypothetical protein
MAIVITCQCGASFRAKDELAGKQVKCPKCQAAIAVPGGQATGAPHAPLSLDELMHLAAAPSEAPQGQAPTFRPPAQPPYNPAAAAYGNAESYGSGAPRSSPGVSPLVIALAIVGSLLVVAVGVVAVIFMMRATPIGPGDTQVSQAQAPTAAEAAPSPPPQMERVKATMDTVGTKGKDYGEGPIATPLSLRWRIPDKVTLLTVQHCINLYWGLEGHYPATHEEFMEKVVAANMIKLPDLPMGQRYVYDVETHELMVERVKQPPNAKP